MLDKALSIARRFPVFPCAKDKTPKCPTGFKAATQDEDRIRFLWGKYGGELVGVPTGEVSGIDALDIDPRNGGIEWYEKNEYAIPVTLWATTISGGRHIFFKHHDGVRNTASKIAKGVDTRGDGGYVIWWRSCYSDTIYDDVDYWPVWLLRILLEKPKPKAYSTPTSSCSAEANTRAAIMLFRAYDRVRNAPAGRRHFEVRNAAITLGGIQRLTGKSSEAIKDDLLHLVMAAGGEDENNARKTVEWAFDQGSAKPLLTSE